MEVKGSKATIESGRNNDDACQPGARESVRTGACRLCLRSGRLPLQRAPAHRHSNGDIQCFKL